MSESEENSLVEMLNSIDGDDIDLACFIVNNMEDNRNIINKLIIDLEECKWYKSRLYENAHYFRKDNRGKFLKLIRDDI